MTRIFGILVIFLFSCGEQKQNSSFNKNDVAEVLNMQVSEWNKGNIDGFMKGYWHSDSLRFIGKRGIKFGFDSITAMYKKHYDNKEKMGSLGFSDLSYTQLSYDPQLVNVTGRWKISGNDSAGGFFSLLMREVNGEWKVITDHTW